MAKSKTHSKERHYKEIIAKQSKVIRELQKRVGRTEKRKEQRPEIELEDEAELAQEFETRSGNQFCPKCSHVLDVIVDGDKIKVYDCDNCGHVMSKKVK